MKIPVRNWCGVFEYEQIRLAARNLEALPQLGRDFQPVSVMIGKSASKHLPQVQPEDLLAAWEEILKRARTSRHYRVARQELSVREHMSRILKTLQAGAFSPLSALFPPGGGRAECVVTFLAMLELVKARLVEVVQDAPFAPIHARLCHVD